MRKRYIVSAVFTIMVLSCATKKDGFHSKEFRETLVSVPYNEQMHLIHALSPEEEWQLWQEKFEDNAKSLNLSNAEKELLKTLYSFGPQAYVVGTAEYEELNHEVDSIVSVLVQKYNWKEGKIQIYLGTVLRENELSRFYARFDTTGFYISELASEGIKLPKQ